ncbi:MAG: hypothetical protein KTR25_20355 [Myxococcales bacterium]|nr:hypothetical protein [Myxococcales bacterium]
MVLTLSSYCGLFDREEQFRARVDVVAAEDVSMLGHGQSLLRQGFALSRVSSKAARLDVPGRGGRKGGEATEPSQTRDTSQNEVRRIKTGPSRPSEK